MPHEAHRAKEGSSARRLIGGGRLNCLVTRARKWSEVIAVQISSSLGSGRLSPGAKARSSIPSFGFHLSSFILHPSSLILQEYLAFCGCACLLTREFQGFLPILSPERIVGITRRRTSRLCPRTRNEEEGRGDQQRLILKGMPDQA